GYAMNDSHAARGGWKQKVVHELRQLVTIFVYLSVFFLGFKLYTRLILAEYRINYFENGLSLLNSLALAKVILTGEALRLGERYRDRPLILPTFYKTAVFSTSALTFESRQGHHRPLDGGQWSVARCLPGCRLHAVPWHEGHDD